MSEGIIRVVLARLRGERRPFTPALPGRVQGIAGLYAFWVGSHCLYVGMSTNLGMRLYQHRRQPHNDLLTAYLRAWWKEIEASCVAMPDISPACLQQLEREAICALRPHANVAIPKAS